ncbi:hypothetical protein MOQ_000170 [Trypanosoma cruzi marinkellei]|uniref:Uncharacterized protein n=1 Tax=Trypanosoma cruzi marinkellei TaxID=85056 RepID=K2NX41_TRYCR|nr:hypothetical protein MOQ_000170 [Trypanosoma cruzi marinkellei]
MRITDLLEENMRLRARQTKLQDQLESLKHQLLAERSARQGIGAELSDMTERLRRTKDQVDKQKKEYSEISLRLCAMTAERDELESKVSEVWRNMAAVEETVRVRELENKKLREAFNNERKEREAQEVLMNAMVAQITALERQVGVSEDAEERHRRLSEDALCSVKKEVQHVARRLERLTDMCSASSLNWDLDQKPLLLLADDDNIDRGVNIHKGDDDDDDDNDVAAAVAGDGLNKSDAEKMTPNDSLSKRKKRLFGPIYQALRHLERQLQIQHEEKRTTQHARRVLESHIAALKDEMHHLGNDGDDVRERLLRSEAQRAQVTETLQKTRQAWEQEATQVTETRRKAASLLHCMDDWCVIEQRISDMSEELRELRSAVEEGHRTHKAYVIQKEREIDAMMDSHQREENIQKNQLEQVRHECERFKRAVATAVMDSSPVSADGAPAEMQREHEAFRVKYRELLRYMENELEPLLEEQAKALQEERKRADELQRANGALRLEMNLMNTVSGDGGGRLSLFEALVLTLRVLSGAMADIREMSQQRAALTRYILAYEHMFGALNLCRESTWPRSLLRFRRAVVAVLAAQRLIAFRRAPWCSGGVIPSVERGTARIRLPPETSCLVIGGLVRLPPVRSDDSAEEFLREEAGTKREKKNAVAFVAERDLQLPAMNNMANKNSLYEAAVQCQALRGFMDSLLAFVTVPSAIWPLRNVREPLWRRLATGLRSLRRVSRQDGGQYALEKPRLLLHLPPRAPLRSEWGESPPSLLQATSNTQRSTIYNRESPHTLVQPIAREVSGGLRRVQESDGENASTAYPAPQPTAYHEEEALGLEEAIRQSLLRDAQFSSDTQEIQSGSGFASEVLNVIRALDQRVVGALERQAKLGECRPHR